MHPAPQIEGRACCIRHPRSCLRNEDGSQSDERDHDQQSSMRCTKCRGHTSYHGSLTRHDPPIPSPTPSQKVLLRADAAATVAVLGEALSEWDAVETDLRAAAGRPAEELDSVLVASQVMMSTVIRSDDGSG